ncbi:V-type ATP synthase subunit D [Methylomonas sp. LL1]|uniref:V-type ATP synthase subunit D n=1 Tax=Methylomonas sp. LL1 TaxID=2785785 RepID=UPI0018C3CC7C|nr:V-type ATP synthase subunit D [Methylomonas sp. LL1]QPK64385.1 V-type ATP synthase subunit D [Methylomonas sp. LL1]CAG1020299.1 V/A-type H+/Na+-transporting ATPase subunit D [Methylococcales bacterium]
MARLSLNKASLHRENGKLKRYQQYLPSLEMKRQKLVIERAKGWTQLESTRQRMAQCQQVVINSLPMISNLDIDLDNLVKVGSVELDKENIVGINLPVLKQVELINKPYSPYLKPHWVDGVVVQLREMLELQVQHRVEQQRLQLLNAAVKKVTQKVNLFDKVLIPKSQQNIRKIRIFLSDAERADVVRSKITKQLRAKSGD